MNIFGDLPPERRPDMEALDLRLGGNLTRRFAEGVTPEERREGLREVDRIEEKVAELRDDQDHTPPGLVDVEAVNEDLLEWARATGDGQDETS